MFPGRPRGRERALSLSHLCTRRDLDSFANMGDREMELDDVGFADHDIDRSCSFRFETGSSRDHRIGSGGEKRDREDTRRGGRRRSRDIRRLANDADMSILNRAAGRVVDGTPDCACARCLSQGRSNQGGKHHCQCDEFTTQTRKSHHITSSVDVGPGRLWSAKGTGLRD